MAVGQDRDTKAELNRRGQACEVLTGTGISRRGKGIPSAPNWGPAWWPCASTFDGAGSLRRTGFTWEMDGHEGSAPSTPVWKTGVYL
jgi:hypothetical protein